jgi:hypothetical protein
LATGDAGWTTAGDLPARWVVHTVGPNYAAGQRDRSLLESCYRRATEVADELGARSIAFPLISAGVYRWPLRDAVRAAIDTLAAADTQVDEVRLVAYDPTAHTELLTRITVSTAIRILQGVRAVHDRGYHRVRALPGMSASGLHWRVAIMTANNLGVVNPDAAIHYSTGALKQFAGGKVTVTVSPQTVADLIMETLPENAPTSDDPEYVSWFADLMQLVEVEGMLPIAYADGFDDSDGWEVGWGSGIRHPHPPLSPR